LYTAITNAAYIAIFNAAAIQASSFSKILMAKYTLRETHPTPQHELG
jgi:hypothetical protein